MNDGADTRHLTQFAFLLVNDFTLISMSSAIEPLRMANRISRQEIFRWKILSETGDPVCASDGLSVNVDFAIDDAAALAGTDVLIVCGGWNIESNATETAVRWLRSLAGKRMAFGSTCTGSYVLAAAGLLDGYRCSVHWENMGPMTDPAPEGTPTMHIDEFVRGKGYFAITGFVPTDERTTRRYPLLLTTGRILSQYNVGAQTRRTANSEFYSEDVLELHPFDAEERGINAGDWCGISSRAGETVLRAVITDKVQPGVVYTTFHFPFSGANVITTDNSDWATNCPEYKVTAVQVTRVSEQSEWQKEYRAFAEKQEEFLDQARV